MIAEDLHAALSATFAARVYPVGVALPNPVALPYCIYQMVFRASENDLGGVATGAARWLFQVDVFGASYLAAHSAAEAARSAAKASFGARLVDAGARDQFEEAVKVHRVSMDWQIHES